MKSTDPELYQENLIYKRLPSLPLSHLHPPHSLYLLPHSLSFLQPFSIPPPPSSSLFYPPPPSSLPHIQESFWHLLVLTTRAASRTVTHSMHQSITFLTFEPTTSPPSCDWTRECTTQHDSRIRGLSTKTYFLLTVLHPVIALSGEAGLNTTWPAQKCIRGGG